MIKTLYAENRVRCNYGVSLAMRSFRDDGDYSTQGLGVAREVDFVDLT